MTVLLMGVVCPLLFGYGICRLLAPRIGPALQISLGSGIGAGLLSGIFFVSLVAGLPPLISEVAALMTLATAAVFVAKKNPVSLNPSIPWAAADKVFGAVFLLTSVGGVIGFLWALHIHPYGRWDGWVIWNTRAAFLATPAWRDAFSQPLLYSHPDYPLLLPGFVARIWKVTGTHDSTAALAAATLFSAATVGVLVSSLAALKGRAQGFAAGIVLTSTHFFAAHSASEYADVPLSFFVLATFAVFALSCRRTEGEFRAGGYGLALLGGLSAGLAAWTKNEGWPLVVAVLGIGAAQIAIGSIRNRMKWQEYRREILMAAGGLASILAMVLYFKYAYATANDFVGSGSLGNVAILATNPDRYKVLFRGLMGLPAAPGNSKFLTPVLAVALYAFFSRNGVTGAGPYRVTARMCAIALAVLLSIYCATVIISPWEIRWQVSTALDRLLLQLLPAGVFTAFLALPAIE